MTELGEFDRCAKLDFVKYLAEAWIGELWPPPAQGLDELVQLMRRYPAGEQSQPYLLQAPQHRFSVGMGLAPVIALVADFLNRQYAVDHIDSADAAFRRRLGAGRQFGREPSS